MAEEMEVRRAVSGLLERAGVPPGARDAFLAMAEVLTEGVEGAAADAGLGLGSWWRNPRALRARARRVLAEVEPLLVRCEDLAVRAGTWWPMPPERSWLEPLAGGAVAGGATLVGEVGAVGSIASGGAAALVTTAVVQLLETYFAASARTNAYRRHELHPDPELILRDVHAASGTSTIGRTRGLGRAQVLTELADLLAERTASALWQAFAVGVGAAASGVGAARRIRRVRDLAAVPLQAPTPDRHGRRPTDGVHVVSPGQRQLAGWLRDLSAPELG